MSYKVIVSEVAKLDLVDTSEYYEVKVGQKIITFVLTKQEIPCRSNNTA